MNKIDEANDNDLTVKATLILGGDVHVPEGFSHPSADVKDSESGTFMIGFGNSRVYKNYSTKTGDFELSEQDGRYCLSHQGTILIDDVQFIERCSHAPNQANINVSSFDSEDKLMDALEKLIATGTVKGISLSTGPDSTDDECMNVIKKIKESYPDIPIGFSYRICSKHTLQKFKDAGLNEFKVNIGSTADRIFAYLNPGKDLAEMLQCLEDAVAVFGKGKVATSLFVGMGETDEEMEKTFEDLASRGVLCDIKVKKLSPETRKDAESVLGKTSLPTVEKIESYAQILKRTEKKYDLDSNTYRTLCIACRGCNLVPFIDY